MLRRIGKSPDGRFKHSVSGLVLPGCASLIVPLLAATALELPAAAIDRIAAPLLGRSEELGDIVPPASPQGPRWGGDAAPGTNGSLVPPGLFGAGALGLEASAQSGGAPFVLPTDGPTGDGEGLPWHEWTDGMPEPPAADSPAGGPQEDTPGSGDEGGSDGGVGPTDDGDPSSPDVEPDSGPGDGDDGAAPDEDGDAGTPKGGPSDDDAGSEDDDGSPDGDGDGAGDGGGDAGDPPAAPPSTPPTGGDTDDESDSRPTPMILAERPRHSRQRGRHSRRQ